jgi:hypothetical protein
LTPDITFSQLARLCYFGSQAPLTIARAQSLMAMPGHVVPPMLGAATDLGYLSEKGTDWALTERGARLAEEMQEAMGRAEKTARAVQPYTDFLPTGTEALG